LDPLPHPAGPVVLLKQDPEKSATADSCCQRSPKQQKGGWLRRGRRKISRQAQTLFRIEWIAIVIAKRYLE